MNSKKTKEYRWMFRKIMAQLPCEERCEYDPPFKTIMRIVNRFKKDCPESFVLLQSERVCARNSS